MNVPHAIVIRLAVYSGSLKKLSLPVHVAICLLALLLICCPEEGRHVHVSHRICTGP